MNTFGALIMDDDDDEEEEMDKNGEVTEEA
jgi:hypothetical protein